MNICSPGQSVCWFFSNSDQINQCNTKQLMFNECTCLIVTLLHGLQLNILTNCVAGVSPVALFVQSLLNNCRKTLPTLARPHFLCVFTFTQRKKRPNIFGKVTSTDLKGINQAFTFVRFDTQKYHRAWQSSEQANHLCSLAAYAL